MITLFKSTMRYLLWSLSSFFVFISQATEASEAACAKLIENRDPAFMIALKYYLGIDEKYSLRAWCTQLIVTESTRLSIDSAYMSKSQNDELFRNKKSEMERLSPPITQDGLVGNLNKSKSLEKLHQNEGALVGDNDRLPVQTVKSFRSLSGSQKISSND